MQFDPTDVAADASRKFEPATGQPSVMTSDEARGAESSRGGGECPSSVDGSPSGEQVPSRGDDGPTRGGGHQGGDVAPHTTNTPDQIWDRYYEDYLLSKHNANQCAIARLTEENAVRARMENHNAEFQPSTTPGPSEGFENNSNLSRLQRSLAPSLQNSADHSRTTPPRMDTQPPRPLSTLSTAATTSRQRSSLHPRPLGPPPGAVCSYTRSLIRDREGSSFSEDDRSPPFQIQRRGRHHAGTQPPTIRDLHHQQGVSPPLRRR